MEPNTQPSGADRSAEKNEYRSIYTEHYYSGRDSFFYKIFGGYKDVRPYFDRLARWFDPWVEGPRLLDIGCAYGYFLSRFHGRGELHGVDVSAHAIDVARGLYPGMQFQTATLGLEPLPYPDNTFRTVFATDVMEHLRYDHQPSAAADVLRILEPGGHWLITTPNRSLIRRIFYAIPDRMEHHFGMRDHRGWIRFFESAGFEIADFWTYLHGMLPFRWRHGVLPELALVLRKPAA